MNIGSWQNGIYNMGAWQGFETPAEITESVYYNLKIAPRTEEVKNSIVVDAALPIFSGSSSIYSSDEVFTIPAGETEVVVTISFSNVPVDPATVIISITPVSGSPSIDSSDDYIWGSKVTVTGTSGDTFKLGATGNGATLSNTQYSTEDSASVLEYGKRVYEFPENPLIQSYDKAKEIADTLLPTCKDLRKDARIQWPGNTIVEIGDLVNVVEFSNDSITTSSTFYVVKQRLKFNGSLDVDTELRRRV